MLNAEYSTSLNASLNSWNLRNPSNKEFEWNGWDDHIAYCIDAPPSIASGSTKSIATVHRDDPWMDDDYYYFNSPPPLGVFGKHFHHLYTKIK